MKKKELKPVDHSKISYLDVRKNLYIIPKSLANVSEEQASNLIVCKMQLEIVWGISHVAMFRGSLS